MIEDADDAVGGRNGDGLNGLRMAVVKLHPRSAACITLQIESYGIHVAIRECGNIRRT